MNIVILTKEEHEQFIYDAVKDYTDHLIFILTQRSDFEKFTDIFSYDFGISFMWLHKVPAKHVNAYPWFNFHPAPLPEYRGRDLCYHAIMNGEKNFGVTVHYMDEKFDTGEIIEVFEFPIHEWYNAEDLSNKAMDIAKKVFAVYFPLILETRVFPTTPNRGGMYYKKSQIIDTVPVRLNDPFGQFVRAVTYKQFYPRIDIGGVKYKIVREE
jgi:methionyl-tRNA formyltransferase